MTKVIIVINLLMSTLLGNRPSWWITHKENVGTNDCKCSQDQRLNVPSEEQRSWR
jgi:hypothetical protein